MERLSMEDIRWNLLVKVRKIDCIFRNLKTLQEDRVALFLGTYGSGFEGAIVLDRSGNAYAQKGYHLERLDENRDGIDFEILAEKGQYVTI